MKKYTFTQSSSTDPFFLEDTKDLPAYLHCKIFPRSDPIDALKLQSLNLHDIECDWNFHENRIMNAGLIKSSLLFDLTCGSIKDALARVLSRLCNKYRENFNPIFAAEWCLNEGKQTVAFYSNKELQEADSIECLKLEKEFDGFEHVGINRKMLDDQFKLRKFNNYSTFDHGLKKPVLFLEDYPEQFPKKINFKDIIQANTSEWNFKQRREFLGKCKQLTINVVQAAKSCEYSYGKISPQIRINAWSGVGFVDMMRETSLKTNEFHWIGVSDYVKLDYICPNFAYHIARMSYNPRIKIIVVYHDIASDIPQSVLEKPKSVFHENQCRAICQSVIHNNCRKPILFSTKIPGLARMLRDAGIHVSPTITHCLEDLNLIVSKYFDVNEIKLEPLTIEGVS